MRRGAIYCVTHSRRHMKLAVQSAKSLKRHMPQLPVTLYTDLKPPANRCFDIVEQLPPTSLHQRMNVMTVALSAPYESFILLDADMWICQPFWEVFELVENPRVDFAAVPIHDWPRKREGCPWMYERAGVPDIFPHFSGGFVAIQRNPRTESFLEEWEACHRWMLEVEKVPEASTDIWTNEPPLRVALFRHPDLRVVPLPRRYNFKQHGILIHAMTVLHKKGGEKELRSIERAVNARAGHPRVICWGKEKVRLD